MKTIEILETDRANQIIKAVKHLIKDFYFEGLVLTFIVTNFLSSEPRDISSLF
jgi:hypothetical protein